MSGPASPKAIDLGVEKAQEIPEASKAQRSSPSASIPNAVPLNQDAQAAVSNLSSLIARVMVAARYLLSGNFDIAATISDMALIEASTKSLTIAIEGCKTAIEGCKNAVVATKDSIVGFTQTLPAVVEAAGRVSTAFTRSFPWLSHFFAQA